MSAELKSGDASRDTMDRLQRGRAHVSAEFRHAHPVHFPEAAGFNGAALT